MSISVTEIAELFEEEFGNVIALVEDGTRGSVLVAGTHQSQYATAYFNQKHAQFHNIKTSRTKKQVLSQIAELARDIE